MTAPEATGFVRYVVGGREVISGPLCDACQVAECTTLRPAEKRGEIKELGAVPLDFRERMAQARHMGRAERIAERTRDLLDEIVSVELHPINLDPYPASVGEVADEIARFVLELDDSGAARGLADKVFEALYRGFVEAGRERAAQDAAQVLATVTDPDASAPDADPDYRHFH